MECFALEQELVSRNLPSVAILTNSKKIHNANAMQYKNTNTEQDTKEQNKPSIVYAIGQIALES